MYLLWFHPQKHPAFFSTTATSPIIFHQHHSKWGNFVDQTCGASSSSYQPADLTSPSHGPLSLQEVVQSTTREMAEPQEGETTAGEGSKVNRKKKQQDEKNNCNLDDWPGRVFVNCWTLTSFEDCWGIRIWSKFTRFKLQLRFSSWPFRSSPRSMYWTKIDCNRPHVSGWQ